MPSTPVIAVSAVVFAVLFVATLVVRQRAADVAVPKFNRHIAPTTEVPISSQPSPLVRSDRGVARELIEAQAGTGTFAIPRSPITVKFRTDERVQVRFRHFPRLLAPVYPTSSSSEYWRGVADAGDGDAAFALYQGFRDCAHQASSTVELCSSVPGQDRDHDAQAITWLSKAVDAQNLYALLEYAAILGNSSEALELHRRAWQLGHIGSLGRMADLYYGVETSFSSDPERAFAYYWLHARLQDLAAGAGRRDYVGRLYAKVRDRERDLTPTQKDTALRLAKEILQENASCCMAP